MIKSPENIRVSVNREPRAPSIFDKIDEKNIKQVLTEANETRRRSTELSERLKNFLRPMSAQNLSEAENRNKSSIKTTTNKNRTHLLTVQEDDVVEFINDIQDDTQNVMDVRVPRIEADMKLNEIEPGKISTSEPIDREYKMLKQLLKDTEETNRRSNELVNLMEKTLINKDVLPKVAKKKKNLKRMSDVSKVVKVEESKRNNIITKKGEKITGKTRPKTTIEKPSINKTKALSKINSSASASRLDTNRKKSQRSSKNISVSEKIAKDVSTKRNQSPKKGGAPGQSTMSDDISEIIGSIGRRDTNNEEMRTYLNNFNKAMV